MKEWYENEAIAHDPNELDKLARSYNKTFTKYQPLRQVQQNKFFKVRG